MSTIDPQLARAARAMRSRQNGAGSALAIIVSVLHLGLWGLAGYGFVQIADTFRLMSLNQVGSGWNSELDIGLPIAFMTGVFLGSSCGFLLTGRVAKITGLAAGMIAPAVTGSLGICLGLLLSIQRWTAPQLVGYKLGFSEGEPTSPWDFWEWTAYRLPAVLPGVFGGIALLSLLLLIRAIVVYRTRNQTLQDVVDTGLHVPGIVTEVLPTGSELSGRPYLRFTVQFTDQFGVDRWVEKKGTFLATNVPRLGDHTVIWFDPADPSDVKRIVVGFGPDTVR